MTEPTTEPTVRVPVAEPTSAVPTAAAPAPGVVVADRPTGPDPFTRGWQGYPSPGHPAQPVSALPAPYVGGPAPYPYARPALENSQSALLAFVFGCVSLAGVAPLALVGLILNWTSWNETSTGRKGGHGLQVAGLVLNLVGVLIGLGVLVFFVLYFVVGFGLLALFASAGYS